ncbi:MAG: hypothetical protein ACFCVC_21015 [Acidimicrobiia bacterium]
MLIAIAGTAGAAESSKLGAPDAAEDDLFGWSVAHDGSRVVVGAPDFAPRVFPRPTGSVAVFDAASGAFVRDLVPVAGELLSGDRYGVSVAAAGNRIVVGASGADDVASGAGEVFVFDAATGRQLGNLNPPSSRRNPASFVAFGSAVDISADRIVVNAPGTFRGSASGVGALYIYRADTFRQVARVVPGDAAFADNFGHALSVAGSTIAASSPWHDAAAQDGGAVYVLNSSNGSQRFKLTANDAAVSDLFGFSVSTNGTLIAVGAPFDDDRGTSSGAVYLFNATTGVFMSKIVPADGAAGDQFGVAVDLVGNNLAIGAWGDDGGAGSVYVFDVTTGAQLDKLVASDAAALDILGRSVALSSSEVVAGAPNDDDGGRDSGSVYRFGLPTP